MPRFSSRLQRSMQKNDASLVALKWVPHNSVPGLASLACPRWASDDVWRCRLSRNMIKRLPAQATHRRRITASQKRDMDMLKFKWEAQQI
jgi:hypothetical protein